jgi:antitoxin component YwqK of YwqJK toxin-antitoxin module
MHTAPGQYIGKLVGFAHGSKEMTFVKGRTKHKITFNDDFSSHHIENNGSTTTEYSRNSFGETHGIMKTTSNNGTPISLTTYENGKLNGPKISYYKTGKISGKTNYKNGELHGLQKSYHENGNLQNESNFHEGNQIGTEKSYFPSGNLESVIENDEKGNFIRSSHYYPHNRPEGNPLYRTKEKVPYGNGHAMKIHKYYENGQLMSTGIFHKGLEEGEHLDFHENGNIARIKKYKAGELHGIHKDFDENGNLKAERLYKNGNLLRENEHGDNLEFIKRRHDNLYGTQIDASENEHSITLHKLVVLKNLRKKGYGSNAMRDITNYADMTGKKVVLTPSTDFGATSVSRLTKFYKGHGFVENKGRNKDFEVSHTMYRNPDKSLFESRKKSSFRSIIER